MHENLLALIAGIAGIVAILKFIGIENIKQLVAVFSSIIVFALIGGGIGDKPGLVIGGIVGLIFGYKFRGK